jgi:3-methyladenine DNA glycosylase/8-oxoguanine DNA glycosylase
VNWPFVPEAATAALSNSDPELGQLIARVGRFSLVPQTPDSTFEALARAIVYQQLSGKAASTIFGRLVAAHPQKKLSPKGLLGLSDATLRGAGISRPKLNALRDLAERCDRREVPAFDALHAMEEEAIIESLTRVRGIGRWSVEMLLMFRLGRPDVLPVTDLGIRKGFMKTFGMRSLPSERTLLRRGERWRPYRTVASWYLWRSLDAPVVI